MPRIATLALLLLSACATSSTPLYLPAPRAEPRVDILDYEIDVAVDHLAGHVQGRVAITFSALRERPARSLVLDAVGLQIHEARDSHGRPLAVDESPYLMEIFLAEALQPGETEIVVIEYEAYPRRGLYVVPPEPGVDGSGWQIWTMGQAEETRHWMPVWDRPNDLATHTLSLTVDADFTSVGAGELLSSEELVRSGRRRDTWRMNSPHAAYLITFVAGEFAVGDLGDEARPLPVFAEPGELAQAAQHLAPTGAMLDFLGAYTGVPYPFGKYAQSFVREFTAGGMENISATTLYDEGLHPVAAEPQIDIEGLIVHEAAHQWFGDLLTCENWGEVWLNEGFAEFSEILWTEHTRGADEAALLAQTKLRNYLDIDDADRHAIVWHGYGDPSETFDSHAYEGAGVRLNLLRHQLGAENFDACVRHYVAEHAHSTVDTDDLLAAIHATIPGYDFTPSFGEWFRETGHPRIRTEVVRDEQGPLLRVEQTQGADDWRDVFHARLRVAWSRGGQAHASSLWMDEPLEALRLGGQGTLEWVYFDADGVLPAEIERAQPARAWATQLRRAQEPLLRLFAAQWFAGDPLLNPSAPDVAATLTEPLLQQLIASARDPGEWPPVRLAALAALAESDDPRLVELRREFVTDADPRFREHAASTLHRAGDDRDLDHLLQLAEDANTVVAVAAQRGLYALGAPRWLPSIAERVWTTSDVRLAARLTTLVGEVDLAAGLPFLLGVAQRHSERWVRAEAVTALGFYAGPVDAVVQRRLSEALFERSYTVRAAAANALAARGDSSARIQLQARLALENDESAHAAMEAALASLQ